MEISVGAIDHVWWKFFLQTKIYQRSHRKRKLSQKNSSELYLHRELSSKRERAFSMQYHNCKTENSTSVVYQ